MRYFWLLVVAALAACTENPQGDGPDAALECSQPNVGTGADILGVRLGMDQATALRILRCAGYVVDIKRALIEVNNPEITRVFELSARMEDDFFKVNLDGVPGREKVVSMKRTLIFGEGSELNVDQIKLNIREKYGIQQEYRDESMTDSGLVVYFQISEAKFDIVRDSSTGGSNAMTICDPHEEQPHPSCGELIHVAILSPGTNEGLAESLSVTISNGIMASQIRGERIRLEQASLARALQREASDAKSRGTPDL